MSNPTNAQPWWHRTNKETLDDRVKAVQNVNDPSIVSDDVQRWSKILLIVLLAFTTLLSAASYLKFFERSFGFTLALMLAVILAGIIEFGKNWGALRCLRIPFFQGWNFIWREVSNTVMWLGLVALAVVTFAASVYNSTRGAHNLSLLLSHERTHTTFQPNTADIDRQIAATEQRITENRATKWKGTTTVDAQRTIKTETKNLATLQNQRTDAINRQRADYEKEVGIKEQQNTFSANSLMAVGGWVELLQLVLLLLRVSAERSMDKTASERNQNTTLPHFNAQNIKGQTQASNGLPHPLNNEAPQRFFFNRESIGGNVVVAPTPTNELTRQPLFPSDTENAVTQWPLTVSQQNGSDTTNQADAVLKLAEKQLRGWVANFGRKDGKDSNVSFNVNRILTRTANDVRQKGFQPTREAWLKFYTYIQGDLFPLLNSKGWPYEFERQFVADVYRIGPEESVPA